MVEGFGGGEVGRRFYGVIEEYAVWARSIETV
jgi:hypothetical protein